jgi:hypothetical protein
LLLAGFFRELRHGSPDGPSLQDCRRVEGCPDEGIIARYLESGESLAVRVSPVRDYFDATRKAAPHLAIMTDGAWAWPSDLAYYLRQYHVELPADFVAHMRQHSFRRPELTEAELVRLDREFRSQNYRP